jgi:hypothetical protein
MSDVTSKDDPDACAQAFVHALVSPAQALGARRELGTTVLARRLGLADEQLGGHWCSRCQGIWYGCMLEVECPCCGNRHG